MHASRGVDVVPVVFAGDSIRLYLPVDTLKPKRTTLLQRVANIEADPRCVLLVDCSENWDELWWVRVHGRASVCSSDDRGPHGRCWPPGTPGTNSRVRSYQRSCSYLRPPRAGRRVSADDRSHDQSAQKSLDETATDPGFPRSNRSRNGQRSVNEVERLSVQDNPERSSQLDSSGDVKGIRSAREHCSLVLRRPLRGSAREGTASGASP